MAEEQRCQEGHRLCANNCGFFGSPSTHNLCSKCYRDYRLKDEQASSAKIAVEKSFLVSSSSSAAVEAATVSDPPMISTEPSTDVTVPLSLTTPAAAAEVKQDSPAPTPAPNRCSSCRKKVGLTGFKCRCGATYCGAHRYPEHHACTFDFKAAGRDAIARANPVVKADKIEKI